MERLTVQELKTKYGNQPWICRDYQEKLVYDPRASMVEIYDYFTCGISVGTMQCMQQMRAAHMSEGDPLFSKAFILGSPVRRYKVGEADAQAVASVRVQAIKRVEAFEDTIEVTTVGTGGHLAIIPGVADEKFVESVVIHEQSQTRSEFTVEYKRFEKIVVGIDDTDNIREGMTYFLCTNLANEIEQTDFATPLYGLTAFLWPKNPHKTSNNCATAVALAVKPGRKKEVIDYFRDSLAKHTFSDGTALVVYEGMLIPKELKQFSNEVRTRMVSMDEATNVAKTVEIDLVPVTGERGLIGAMAAIGFADDLKTAMTPCMV